MEMDSRFSMDRWLSGSKLRMESISSPQSSILQGASSVSENTSRIPPRTANWPEGLHLAAALIAHVRQLHRQLFQIQGAVIFQSNDMIFQHAKRQEDSPGSPPVLVTTVTFFCSSMACITRILCLVSRLPERSA